VLLDVAKEKGIKVHHVSTDEVFGTLALGSTERFT
jgi:dTDP-D-glucose 4,6-dehydratase